jgi:hypothetical protein
MDVAAIHALPDNVAGWLVVIEGIDVAFTNIPDIVGSGAISWIGTTYGARSVAAGLVMPTELKLGETDPWGAQIRSPGDSTFAVVDLDGTLVSLFTDFEPDETTDTLAQRLSPLDDPAPAPGIGLDGEFITLWGRHVGAERIGPAGERRYFWIEPYGAPPGLDHFPNEGWPATHVTDAAVQWAGRKVAVYRIVRDPDTLTWPSWTAQRDGGSLWWIGTMLDTGTWQDVASPAYEGRAFTFQVGGPATWLERTTNLSRPTTWYSPTSGVQLAGDELKVAVWIEPVGGESVGGAGYIDTLYISHSLASGDTLAGCVTATDIFTQVGNIAKTVVDGSNNGTVAAADSVTWAGPVLASKGQWNDGTDPLTLRRVYIAANGSSIGIKCEQGPTEWGFRLCIAMDARAWQAGGWDVTGAPSGPGVPQFLPRELLQGALPVGGANWGEADGEEVMPLKHVVGQFSTRDEHDPGDEEEWDNNGNWTTYVAPSQTGCVTLDDEGGTEVYVTTGVVPCEGQHGSPFNLGSQIDGTDCDTSGWWIFRGMRLTARAAANGEEAKPYVGVALCEWVATSDGVGVEVNDEGKATIKIVRWEDPIRFGLPFPRLGEPWVNRVGVLECAPLGVVAGISEGGPGWRHRAIVTALLSTGTSEWDATGDVVTITPGTNQPGDMDPLEPAGDTEVADLGLGLPAAFVDWASFYTAAAQLPGGAGKALNRVLYPLYGSVKLSTLLREIMAGAGWAWTLTRKVAEYVPAFGCYDPTRLIQPGAVDATLTRADMVETEISEGPQWRGSISLRQGGPYDRFEFTVGGAPIDVEGEGGEPYTITQESADAARRYRSGRITWEVKDRGLRDPAPWLGTPGAQLYDWTGQSRERFASGIGVKLAKQQRVYRATYNARFAGVLGLGTPVHVIDGTCETPSGTRGINHRGRVIECSIVAKGPEKCAVRVAIELERKSVDEVNVWGPMAYSGLDGWDGTDTLTCALDHALVGGNHRDVIGFEQPSWSSHAAGNLLVLIYQSEDGEDFSLAVVTAEVVTTDAIELLELTNITGTLYRDTIKYIVAADHDDQTAEWGAELFIPICAPSGLYNGVDKGIRLK